MFSRHSDVMSLGRAVMLGFLPWVTLFASVPISIAQSPDYVVDKWTTADGLPSSDVYGIARSEDGFLWIGTTKGLARFDGVQFTDFTHENSPGLDADSFADMAAGPDHQVYIATPKGLAILNHGHFHSFATSDENKSDGVQVVLPVGVDEAWCGSVKGHLYHYQRGKMKQEGSGMLSRNTIYGLARERNGTLWIGTDKGLFTLVRGQVSRYRPNDLPVSAFFDLAISDSGSIFAATNYGVLEIQNDTWRFWNTKKGLPSDHVNVLATAPGNVLLIGTDAGVSQLAHGQLNFLRTPPCIATALNLDLENNLWIGCEDTGGLLRVTRPPVGKISVAGKMPGPIANSISEDKAGTIWIATAHGLIRWKRNRTRLFTQKDGLPLSNVYAVSRSPNSSLWIGTADGFANIRDERIISFRTKEPGSEDPIFSILEDHSGTLWIGAQRGLLRRRPGQTKLEEVPNVVSTIWSIREDRQGYIWAATEDNGLFRLSENAQIQFKAGAGLASNTVRDISEAVNGDIWVATRRGLSRIRDGKCLSLGRENGLDDDNIWSFGFDLKGHLWLRMTNGVVAFAVSEADRVIDHGGTITGARFFGQHDGFGEEFTNVSAQNSVILHSSGEMWFATFSGIGRIDPSVLQSAVLPLQPQVTSLFSDTGAHDFTKEVLVKPGDLRIRLTYTAPVLTGTEKPEFRYQLVGFDDTWRPGEKQREAEYTSLPPATYRFKVSVRRPFGQWLDSSIPIEIRVLPHFYQTWWWYTFLAIVLIAFVLMGYQFRLITVRKQFATLVSERLRERSRLARELHDTLSQGMVGISLQIEAAQVLLDVDPKSVSKHLENVGRLARQASIETRRSIAELRSSENQEPTLSAVLGDAAREFERSCTILLETNNGEDLPRFSPEITHEISRFVEEALANVRLHSKAQRAYLTASNSEKDFVLEVRDDGRGFKPEMSRAVPGHFGLTGMNERAQRINGRFQLTTALGKGTSAKLAVPFRARWNGAKSFLLLSTLFRLKQRFRPES